MTTSPLGSARRIACTAGGAFAAFYIFYTSAPATLSNTAPGAGARVGMVMFIVVAVQPFVPLLSRWITNRQGVVAFAITSMGAGSAVMPFAGHWPGMVLLGAGFGVFVVASTAWVKETAPPGGLGKALGIYGFGSAIGGALGAPIGLSHVGEFGITGTALAGSLIALAALLPTLRLAPLHKDTPRPQDRNSAAVDTTRGSRSSGRGRLTSLGAHLVAVTIYAAVLSGLSNNLGDRQVWLPVVVAFTIQSSLAVGRILGGWTATRTSPFKVGFPALVLLTFGAVGFMLSPYPIAIVALSIIVGLASGMSQTVALTALMNRATTTDQTNRASAAWNICFDIGLALGALAIGATLNR